MQRTSWSTPKGMIAIGFSNPFGPHHLARRFTTGIGSVNATEGAFLRPTERRRVLSLDVLGSLQNDRSPGRKPVAERQHLRTTDTERLMIEINQMWTVTAQRSR